MFRALKSTWLQGSDYVTVDGVGFLVLYTLEGGAIIHTGVPPWVRGLLHASDSAGRAYRRLVRGRYHGVSTRSRAVRALVGNAVSAARALPGKKP